MFSVFCKYFIMSSIFALVKTISNLVANRNRLYGIDVSLQLLNSIDHSKMESNEPNSLSFFKFYLNFSDKILGSIVQNESWDSLCSKLYMNQNSISGTKK